MIGSGPGDHVTSYCLVLMVIFFLQVKGVLHALATLQDVPELEEVLLNDFNFSFCTDSSQLPPIPFGEDPTLVELLRGFFTFFADFDFNVFAVCPQEGQPAARLKGMVGEITTSKYYLIFKRWVSPLPWWSKTHLRGEEMWLPQCPGRDLPAWWQRSPPLEGCLTACCSLERRWRWAAPLYPSSSQAFLAYRWLPKPSSKLKRLSFHHQIRF